MPFDYTHTERIVMSIITSTTIIFSIPITLYSYKKNTYNYILSIFTMIFSFFYHLCESLDIIIILPQKKWHELDNISAICNMNSLILGITHFFHDRKTFNIFNYISLFFAIFIQNRGPWEIINTLIPIYLFIIIGILDLLIYGLPKVVNWKAVKYGGGFLVVGIVFFVIGLDDGNDYLRIYHSLWHAFIGITGFYLCQLQEERMITIKEILFDFKNIKKETDY